MQYQIELDNYHLNLVWIHLFCLLWSFNSSTHDLTFCKNLPWPTCLTIRFCVRQAIDLDPNEAVLLSNRSLCWLRLGQGEHALEDARACRALRHDWHKACYREGAALRLLQVCLFVCFSCLNALQVDIHFWFVKLFYWFKLWSLSYLFYALTSPCPNNLQITEAWIILYLMRSKVEVPLMQ